MRPEGEVIPACGSIELHGHIWRSPTDVGSQHAASEILELGHPEAALDSGWCQRPSWLLAQDLDQGRQLFVAKAGRMRPLK